MVHIKRNFLLRGADKTMSLDEARLIMTLMLGDDETLARFHRRFGESGLFRVIMMMYTQPSKEANQFFSFIRSQLPLQSSEVPQEITFKCDNALLPQGPEVDALNTHVLQPSLARKLYHPGFRHGFVVWGLGGPDMLVSHPFRGVLGGTYSIVEGTRGIAEYLMANGYVGSYLFVDLLPGLSFEVRGQPAWLVWFAIIAAHSDVVLFVREQGSDFTDAQKLEIRFTPDRVQKKIIEVPAGVLRPRSSNELSEEEEEILYFTGTPDSSKEKFEEIEAKYAESLVRTYPSIDIPRNRLVRLDEHGQATYYPIDYPLYNQPDPRERPTLVERLRRWLP